MIILNIKQMILEGYSYEDVLEETKKAGTQYEKNTTLGKLNRPDLAANLIRIRQDRDNSRLKGQHSKANYLDNQSRIQSQDSSEKNKSVPKYGYNISDTKATYEQPRLYQSAKK